MASLMDIRKLYLKQRKIELEFNKCEQLIQQYKEGDDLNIISNRLNEMPSLKNHYEEIMLDLAIKENEVDSDDDTPESRAKIKQKEEISLNSISSFNERWHKLYSKMQSLTISTTNMVQNAVTNNNNSNVQPKIRLPEIKLPVFNGNYSEWLLFYDAFKSLIHDNKSIDEFQKLHYLRGNLKGEPLHAIESLSTSDANYNTAWKILIDRYHNTRLIIQEHVKSILNSPQVTKNSSTALRKLVDDIRSNLEALKNLKIQVDTWDAILIPIIIEKLDYNSRKEFEETQTKQMSTVTQLIEFLEKRCMVLESINTVNHSNTTRTNQNANKVANVSANMKFACLFCKQNHYLNQCLEFLNLDPKKRLEEIKKRKMCTNCLRTNHEYKACTADVCKKCKKKHHTLLHDPSRENTSSTEAVSAHCLNASPDLAILLTAVVLVKDAYGNYLRGRILLDPGSQISLISEAFYKSLGLKSNKVQMSISGVNQTSSKVSQCVDIHFKGVSTSYSNAARCYIVKKASEDLPNIPFNIKRLNIPHNINLADPKFNIPNSVELLIGIELFWDIVQNGHTKLTNDLFLINSQLGYLIGGVSPQNSGIINNSICNLAIMSKEDELQCLLERFWKQEEINTSTNLTEEELRCEQNFIETHKRDTDGRFIVELPFKSKVINLGDSSLMAIKRFFCLEKRFRKDPDLKQLYVNAVNELVKLGFLKKISEFQSAPPNTVCYLPHTGVVKLDRVSTKTRIVFDGSAKTENGVSLNDNLLTGPNLQNDLFSILIRFRKSQFILSADITKMFCQIKVCGSHQNFQRMIWRKFEDEPIVIYQYTRLVFGLTNSPFTAIRCIRQLIQEASEEFPEACEILQNDVFTDDVLIGADNTDNLIKLRDQIIDILNRGCFELSKWTSNNNQVLPNPNAPNNMVELQDERLNKTKVLGLFWNPNEDSFHYKIQPIESVPNTKRSILSYIAKLFDPIGLISPIIVQAKMIMKQIWSLNLGWDDVVPKIVQDSWDKFVRGLQEISGFQIPRKTISVRVLGIELIAFCDASEKAFGASIYVRSQISADEYNVVLLCSKSRVSPMKTLTIPRLELSAAVLAAELMSKISECLKLEKVQRHYFTDSTIVLYYIYSRSNSFQTFVANRIAKIQTLSNAEEWRHVEGKQNPADIISRGAEAKFLTTSDLYWNGPLFLKTDMKNWPPKFPCIQMSHDQIPEIRKVALLNTKIHNFPMFAQFNDFRKLLRVFAYVQRFIFNTKKPKEERNKGPLHKDEIRSIEVKIISLIQASTFLEEKQCLENGKVVSKNSKLVCLNPFLDKEGLIRVGGRLRNANISNAMKHPIVLPTNNTITSVIIKTEHIRLLHAGPLQTLTSVRAKYWPLRGLSQTRRIIHCCLNCFRVNPKLLNQQMGNLPADRVTACRPFLKVGIDYFGPIKLKSGNKRSRVLTKAWVALFVCMSTRAIHLEIVSDLTSVCFINALKRVIARRGKISTIYCDNATTFVGADRELREIHNFLNDPSLPDKISNFLNSEGISFKFIPPRAPNFGGLWERLVKSAKQHFKRNVLNLNLIYEEANMLLCQIEAVINSRPLSPLSSDPNDFQPLTPAHFLIGEPLTELPEVDQSDVPINRLKRWQRIEQVKQNFWKRWSNEVLVQLQPRPKWCSIESNVLRPGILVMIAEDNLPPLMWKTGRIEELFPGADGVIRVASLKTPNGIVKRSIRKLAILPVEDGPLDDPVDHEMEDGVEFEE